MIRAVLVSTQDCDIIPLGRLERKGFPMVLTESDIHRFERFHKVKIGEANFPPHVQLTVEVI
jgi:hypothetical protein